jgi:hypothetical protein
VGCIVCLVLNLCVIVLSFAECVILLFLFIYNIYSKVSSGAIFNLLKERHPELIDPLFETMLFDTRGDGSVDYFAINPSRYYKGVLRTFLHIEYMETAYQHKSAPQSGLPPRHKQMLLAYSEIANEIALDMDFMKGDMQLVSNHIVLHARTAFKDYDYSQDEVSLNSNNNNNDAGKKIRHLLRMWLSTGASMSSTNVDSPTSEEEIDPLALSLGGLELGRIIMNFIKIKALKLISG